MNTQLFDERLPVPARGRQTVAEGAVEYATAWLIACRPVGPRVRGDEAYARQAVFFGVPLQIESQSVVAEIEGRAQIGLWAALASPYSAEIAASSGTSFINQQHFDSASRPAMILVDT